MGINYTARLCFGYSFSEEKVLAPFKKVQITSSEGVFHMEPRWDSITGLAVKPVKVWDEKPTRNVIEWLEINNNKIEDDDLETIIPYLENLFNCFIESFGDHVSGESTLVFYVNHPVSYNASEEYGKLTLYNKSLSLKQIQELTPKVLSLKDKLMDFNIKVDEPSCFLAMQIS